LQTNTLSSISPNGRPSALRGCARRSPPRSSSVVGVHPVPELTEDGVYHEDLPLVQPFDAPLAPISTITVGLCACFHMSETTKDNRENDPDSFFDFK